MPSRPRVLVCALELGREANSRSETVGIEIPEDVDRDEQDHRDDRPDEGIPGQRMADERGFERECSLESDHRPWNIGPIYRHEVAPVGCFIS